MTDEFKMTPLEQVKKTILQENNELMRKMGEKEIPLDLSVRVNAVLAQDIGSALSYIVEIHSRLTRTQEELESLKQGIVQQATMLKEYYTRGVYDMPPWFKKLLEGENGK